MVLLGESFVCHFFKANFMTNRRINKRISLLYLLYGDFMENDLLKRITHNPNVCIGKLTIRNMHRPVEMILDLPAAEMMFEELLKDHADLERSNLKDCRSFAGNSVKSNSID